MTHFIAAATSHLLRCAPPVTSLADDVTRTMIQGEAVIALLAELAERFPEYGFDKLFQIIRPRGLPWNQQNGFIERFNDSFRRSILDMHVSGT
jgi:hypothetical protein